MLYSSVICLCLIGMRVTKGVCRCPCWLCITPYLLTSTFAPCVWLDSLKRFWGRRNQAKYLNSNVQNTHVYFSRNNELSRISHIHTFYKPSIGSFHVLYTHWRTFCPAKNAYTTNEPRTTQPFLSCYQGTRAPSFAILYQYSTQTQIPPSK